MASNPVVTLIIKQNNTIFHHPFLKVSKDKVVLHMISCRQMQELCKEYATNIVVLQALKLQITYARNRRRYQRFYDLYLIDR